MKKIIKINDKLNNVRNFIYVVIILLIGVLGYITIIKNDYYKTLLNNINDVSYELKSSPRGRIYDRNGNILVDNKKVPVLYYLNTSKKNSLEEIDIIKNLIKIVNIDYSKVTLRNIKDYYLVLNDCDDLITNEEWELFKLRKLTNSDIYNLKISRLNDSIINELSEEDKKIAYIFFLMHNGYSYEFKTIKKDNLSDKEISNLSDNMDLLPGFFIDYTYEREYLYGDTFRSILGNISKISIEDKEYYMNKGYSLSDSVGISFIEKQYEEYLQGIKGTYKIENGKVIMLNNSKRGKDIYLTIDIKLQQEIEKILEEELINAKSEENTQLFNSVYVVIKDPKNGDILAMSGKGIKRVDDTYVAYDLTPGVITNSMTPGSVVKGASIMVGYKEGAINIGEEMVDNCVKLYNIPKKCSWKELGVVNDIKALSLSSNVFQFKTALKVANIDYKYNMKIEDVSIAFNKYREFFKSIGLGSKSEIDLPIDGIGNVGKKDSPDLYLNYVIGQYDAYTTMQLSEYISTIANYGKRVRPHLLLEVKDNNRSLFKYVPITSNLDIEKKYIDRVREGFQEVMENGLGRNFMGNVFNPSGKTGTSETFYDSNNDGIIDTPTVSNAFVGYYPSDNPKMSIAITLPNIMRVSGNENRSYANKIITKRIVEVFDKLYK